MIVCISYYIILWIRSDHLCVLICMWEIHSDIQVVRLSAPPLTIVYLVANAYSNKYVHRYLIYSSYDITVALRYYDYLIW